MLTVALTIAACGLTGQPAALLERIVAVESGGLPNAIHVNGGFALVRQPEDRGEAIATARWLQERGHSFDAGLVQLNSANLARLGLTVEKLFDPCTNLRAGARVLEECRTRAEARFGPGGRAEAASLSCFNTGDLERGVRNGYVTAVQRAGARRAARPAPWRAAGEAPRTEECASAPDVFEQAKQAKGRER